VLLPITEAILYRAQSGDCRIVRDLDIVLLHFGRCVGFENGHGHAREVLGEERHVIQSILGLILKIVVLVKARKIIPILLENMRKLVGIE
jgi:hypothetical protein